MRYYIIRDSKGSNNIIAIHKTPESSTLTFNEYIQNGHFINYLELMCIITDDNGLTMNTEMLSSYSKYTNHTIIYKKIEDTI